MTTPAAAQFFANPAAASAFAAHRAAQIDEYGQWEAAEPIVIGGVLAFATGHPVPASTVEAHPELMPQLRRTAPPSLPGVDRTEQLRARQKALADEAAAIEAELAAAAEDGTDDAEDNDQEDEV